MCNQRWYVFLCGLILHMVLGASESSEPEQKKLSAEQLEMMQKLDLEKAEYEEAFNDPKTDQLFNGIIGIVAADNLKTKKSPQKDLPQGLYQPSSVKCLAAWLRSPIENILEVNQKNIKFGRTTLKFLSPFLVVNGEKVLEGSIYDPAGLARVRRWCALLVQNHRTASKRKLLPHETLPADMVKICVPSVVETDERVEADLKSYEQEMHECSLSDAEPDAKRAANEQIRRNIGSYFALRMAQRGGKTYELIHTGASELEKSKDMFAAGGRARALYNRLCLESYTAASDTEQIPPDLQHQIESFLYDPYQMMYRLHSLQKFARYDRFIKTDFFLVGNEGCQQFTHMDGKLMRSVFFGMALSDNLDGMIRGYIPQAIAYTSRKIEGDPQSYYFEVGGDNDSLFSVFYCRKGEKFSANRYGTKKSKIRSIAPNCKGNPWWIMNHDNGMQLLCRMEDTRGWVMKRGVDLLATNDAGDRLLGVIKDDSGVCRDLWSCTHDKNAKAIEQFEKSLAHAISLPVVALGHRNVGAVGGYNAKGELMVATFPVDKKLTQDHWTKIDLPGTLTKLSFSRDDSTLFLTVHPLDEDEKKRSVDQYYMMQHMFNPEKRKVVPCKMPRLKEAMGPKDSLISAIDPNGEYIGVSWSGERQGSQKVIPTEYHLTTNLVQRFKGYQCSDRLKLYWLYAAMNASGLAHISPRQFSRYKALGIRDHILLRPQFRLTHPKGKKLQVEVAGDVVAKKSLSSVQAAVYAEQHIDP